MNIPKLPIIVLCTVVISAISIVGRIWIAFQKPLVEHDEAITLLAATGHQGELAQVMSQQAYPFATLVEGREWRRFLLPEDKFVFGRITSDLGNYDLHPPLYFWMLHIWVLMFGSSALSGVLLNLVLSILVAVVLFFIGKQHLSVPLACLMIVIWLMSPISIRSMIFIRQYHLLTLFGLLYAYITLHVFFLPTSYQLQLKSSLSWMLIAVMLMLTHSVAIFIIFASIVSVVLRAIRHGIRRVLMLALHLMLAVSCVLLIYPSYIGQFAEGRGVSETNFSILMERIHIVTGLLLAFIVDLPYQTGIYSWVRPVLILGMVLGLVLISVVQIKSLKSHGIQQIYRHFDAQAMYWGIFFMVVAGGAATLYLAGMAPIDYRYFTQALAFATFLPAYLLKLSVLNRIRSSLIFCAFAVMLLSGGLVFKQVHENYQSLGNPSLYPDRSEFILVNISLYGRGHLMQVAYNLPDDAPVYIDETQHLLNHSAVWLEHMSHFDTTLLLGFPNAELFQIIQDAGYQIEPYGTYLYYTSTQRVTNP